MPKDLYELKEELGEQNIFFCFIGPISQILLSDIIAILEQKMTTEKVSRATVLRVFSVVVEKAQNILHYANEMPIHSGENHHPQGLPPQGIIAVGDDNGHYFVMSGNMVENSKVEKLRKKLTKLQQMNKDELKQYYREQRRLPPEKGSRGAGLGFIEVAKKASKPIEFEFKKIDENVSFFSLKTFI